MLRGRAGVIHELRRGVKPEQSAQTRYLDSFMRRAQDIAACLYYPGLAPFTKEEAHVARRLRDRKLLT